MSAALPVSLYAAEAFHHEMRVSLKPETHFIEAEDKITLPEKGIPDTDKLTFSLHEGLEPTPLTTGIKISPVKFNSPPEDSARLYNLSIPPGIKSFTLSYKGTIYHPVEQVGTDYDKSFKTTPGMISPDGIYLGEDSFWYPRFGDYPVTFSLDVRLPRGWSAVSQGNRAAQSEDKEWAQVKWDSPEPQEKVFLVGNKFTEYDRESPYVQAMVFLRQPEKPLADKYLEATVQYIDMYSKLIGHYPYKKFALVENFWESGYGMPSFTLLGPKIIRFPFILHSSYPHEILHNWWGNGVFVDYGKGNWCEGLTVYLADYLIKEQQGEGLEYRRSALQRYTDYVRGSKDFPLTDFRSRHSAVTQAVGYDKAMMFFHMLRMALGDAVFVKGLQKFYQDNKFRYATYEDLRTAFAAVSGRDLKTEFDQWVKRPGVPELTVQDVNFKKEGEKYVLYALVQQTQPGPAYKLDIPIVVYTDRSTTGIKMPMQDKQLKLRLPFFPEPPLRMDIDPEFDLIRRLSRDEIPASLSQAFGADKVLILLPAEADKDLLRGYRQLAESWKASGGSGVEIKLDYDVDKLPADCAIWVLGWENRFRHRMSSLISTRRVWVSDDKITISGLELDKKDAAVFAIRNPENPDNTIVWLATGKVNAIPDLERRLPHYAKYSYLLFREHGPNNVIKGQWSDLNSPLTVLIPQEDSSLPKNIASPHSKRKTLIEP